MLLPRQQRAVRVGFVVCNQNLSPTRDRPENVSYIPLLSR
jgi:hypothetical protein